MIPPGRRCERPPSRVHLSHRVLTDHAVRSLLSLSVAAAQRATYDDIGVDYDRRRRPDPRLAARIDAALGRAEIVVNIGAGTGAYEPHGRRVLAVEPAQTMLDQRGSEAAPVVRAVAERLPLGDECCDASLAVLTAHHWNDLTSGLREMVRVSMGRQVLVTWDQTAVEEKFWFIRDYAPEMMPSERAKCPPMSSLERVLGRITVLPLLIPMDCTDGFLVAYWRRPEAYLDSRVRASISAFALCEPWRYEDALARLEADLASGRWHERYEGLRRFEELDLGYRIVIGHASG
jgi:SAM-dependent methyltransferase